MSQLNRGVLILACLLFSSWSYGQSFSEFIAPQFNWKSTYETQLPTHPYDSLTSDFLNQREESWAYGMSWRKPFPKKPKKLHYLVPLWQTTHFNTVQGWETSLIYDRKINSNLVVEAGINYGFSERVLRPQLALWLKKNNQHMLYFKMGQAVKQFNESPAIVPRANTIASLLFENNFAKFYESTFIQADHQYNTDNRKGYFQIKNSLKLLKNSPLRNNSSQFFFNDPENSYASNHPFQTDQYRIDPFASYTQISHELYIKLASKPPGATKTKQTIGYYQSTLFGVKTSLPLAQEVARLSQSEKYSYAPAMLFIAQHKQLINIPFFGSFSSFIEAGAFKKEQEIPFVDFKHFNGNQTQVVRGPYLENFHLLPYYILSTDQSFASLHLEHNFKGFLMNKIPLFKEFNWAIIASFKQLALSHHSPYKEVGIGIGNIGFKNNKILRVDYVQSYFKNQYSKGFLIGLVF